MSTRNITKPARKWIKSKIINTYLEFEATKSNEEDKLPPYFPYKDGEECFVINGPEFNEKCEFDLPIPPQELWLGYGSNSLEYLHGKEQVAKMVAILKADGFDISTMKRVMDFGCGAGRMVRWLKPYSEEAEIWGIDISADHITWAINNLSPPFNFATTTTVPHLPFEERYFDLIYAGSVFTHIDDLVEAWLLELRRILRSRGCIYITIQDKHSIEVLKTSKYYKDIWLKKYVEENPFFRSAGKNFDKIVGLRGTRSQVFYDQEYFKKIAGRIFEVVAMHEEAYGFQTGVVLRKK
jgi:ubiquinone/menaquinone biosynthesis C-methylase UbiE